MIPIRCSNISFSQVPGTAPFCLCLLFSNCLAVEDIVIVEMFYSKMILVLPMHI